MKKKLFLLLLAALLLLTVPALAAEEGQAPVENLYVIDLYGLLSENETDILTNAARQITETYDCGVHIGVIGDMRDYGFSNIEDCAESFFDSFGLGVGEDHAGILLLLSMAERDYDIDAHGSFGHYAFTDYGKTTISDVFLDNFRENDWYGGFFDYLARCEEMLRLARNGEPVDIHSEPVSARSSTAGTAVTGVISLLAAWGVCSGLKGRNKSVAAASDADAYIPAGAVSLRVRDDRFVNRTVTRRRIERDTGRSGGGGGGGGTTISSGGHSHSSGKF